VLKLNSGPIVNKSGFRHFCCDCFIMPFSNVRNPTYISVLTLVSGGSIYLGSPLMALYVVAIAVAFHVRVINYEKPLL
jgi:hypothetical protein